MNTIDLRAEFLSLLRYVMTAWCLPSPDAFEQVAREAFNQGLSDAQLWIDEHLLYRLGSDLNQSPSNVDPLNGRRQRVSQVLPAACFYDGLCFVDSLLRDIFSQSRTLQTGAKAWDFSRQADDLAWRLRNMYPLGCVEPHALPSSEQAALVGAYSGFLYAGPGGLPVTRALTYDQATYSRDEQGYSYARTLIGAFYSHGLSCAEERNNRETLNILRPVYSCYRDTDACFDNAELILNEVSRAPLVGLGVALKSPTLPSKDDFLQRVRQQSEREALIASETPEQAAEREAANKLALKRMIQEIVGKQARDAHEQAEFSAEAVSAIAEFRKNTPPLAV